MPARPYRWAKPSHSSVAGFPRDMINADSHRASVCLYMTCTKRQAPVSPGDTLPPNTAIIALAIGLRRFRWCAKGSKFVTTQTTRMIPGHQNRDATHFSFGMRYASDVYVWVLNDAVLLPQS